MISNKLPQKGRGSCLKELCNKKAVINKSLTQRGNLIRHQRVTAFPKCIQEPLSQKGGPGV